MSGGGVTVSRTDPCFWADGSPTSDIVTRASYSPATVGTNAVLPVPAVSAVWTSDHSPVCGSSRSTVQAKV